MTGATDNDRPHEIFALDSSTWAQMLREGLEATVLAVRSPQGEVSGTLAVFAVGPFRLGYADFPVGSVTYTEAELAALVVAARDADVDVLRLHSREPLSWNGRIEAQDVGTRIIADLQRWQPLSFEKARRARNRLRRSALRIEAASASDAPQIDALYRATVDRHRGSIRYGESYFRAIAARTTLVARLDADICGFVSFACRGAAAFYLHGGYSPAAKDQYPSDQLFYTMLTCLREAGIESLDFLPSPPGQESLLRYKEAWGGEPAPFLVSDITLRPWRGALLGVARKLGVALPRRLLAQILRRSLGQR